MSVTSTVNEWAQLQRVAQRVADQPEVRSDMAARAARLAQRLGDRRFHIAVMGEFKRGKSTLINALVGRPLLPSGVVPLTMVATEVHVGASGAIVAFDDGRRMAISPDAIGDYVTEAGNPANGRGVSRVEVGVDTGFGAPGLVLVDTPGVASVNEHNTATAHDALLDSDGAVVVLSADSPLSKSEEALISELNRRHAKVFVVINKSDHLSATEVDQVRSFVAEHLGRLLGYPVHPYCMAARRALDAVQGGMPGHPPGDFHAFRDALEAFVTQDLAAAGYEAAIGELQRLGAELTESINVEEAAAALDIESLAAQIHQFRAAANEGCRLMEEDRLLLEHDVAHAATDIGDRLARSAEQTARARRPMLSTTVGSPPFGHLEDALRGAIQHSVEEGFEPLRRAAQDQAEQAWRAAAGRFADRVQARVDEVRAAAGQLFDVHLPVVTVPTVVEQRGRFSYLFFHIESPNAIIGRFVKVLLPTNRARQRALRTAERRLVKEFDKHAGRGRYDITERLDEAKRLFIDQMTAEFAQTETSILMATARAQSNFDRTESEQRIQRQVRNKVRSIIDDIAAEVGRAAPGPIGGQS